MIPLWVSLVRQNAGPSGIRPLVNQATLSEFDLADVDC